MDIYNSIETFVENYQNYAILIIFLFALIHPLTENPWSFLTLSLAITFVGIPLGYATIFTGYILGILLLYVIAHGINRKTNYVLLEKKVSKNVLQWIKNTDTWRHIVVIGVPSIPTYPIKIALPFSEMSLKRYFLTLMGSYLFLQAANTILYYGLIAFITDNIPSWLGYILLLIFALYIYFGRTLRRKTTKEEES